MKIKDLFVEFGAVFAVTLTTVALVTFLWNLISHGQGAVDWETAFSFAIAFGIILTWTRMRDIKNKSSAQTSADITRKEI